MKLPIGPVPRLSTLAIAALLAPSLLALPQAAAAQVTAVEGAEARDPAVFGETIDVRVVNVEVVVEDEDGIRVTGLAPGDFRLVVDGEEVAIDYFTEILGGEAVRRAPPADGSAAVESVPAVAPGEAIGTSYLVFIDDYFAIERDRNGVLEALKADLPGLAPGDRMAVVAFDGRRVEMLTTWSDSGRQLERAFQDALGRPAFGLQRVSERRVFENVGASEGGNPLVRGARSFGLDAEERVYASALADQLRRSVAAAVATLRGFALPPGRKVMLLLAGGWPYSVASFVVDNPARVITQEQVTYGPGLLAPLTETANLLGYTLYPVDVPGHAGAFGAETDDRILSANENRFGDNLVIDSLERERQVEWALKHIAETTGGRAVINADRVDAFETAVADTRTYYWLGFTADRRRDGRERSIRVEVTRPGLRVRSRSSYTDLTVETERAMAAQSALLFGNAPAAPLVVEAGAPEPAERRGEMEMPVRILLPVGRLASLPTAEGHVVRVELRFAAIDEEQRESDMPSIPVSLTLTEEPPENGVVAYDTRLLLRRDHQTVIISVHDAITGRQLATQVEVSPSGL
jgi:VWFA-related protein